MKFPALGASFWPVWAEDVAGHGCCSKRTFGCAFCLVWVEDVALAAHVCDVLEQLVTLWLASEMRALAISSAVVCDVEFDLVEPGVVVGAADAWAGCEVALAAGFVEVADLVELVAVS